MVCASGWPVSLGRAVFVREMATRWISIFTPKFSQACLRGSFHCSIASLFTCRASWSVRSTSSALHDHILMIRFLGKTAASCRGSPPPLDRDAYNEVGRAACQLHMPRLKIHITKSNMANKRDPTLVVAEFLSSVIVAGGAAVATTVGVPVLWVVMGKEIITGLSKYVIGKLSNKPDPKEILNRIRDERTAQSAETIRYILVEAMGLKPELKDSLEELADAVQGREDGRDEVRFQAAFLRLLTMVTAAAATLTDIKTDTTVIRESIAALGSDVQEIKSACGVNATPGSTSEASGYYSHFRAESLSLQLREVLDEKGRHLWEEINTALAEHSWKQAFELAQAMEEWLDTQGDRISIDVKIQGLLVLADVAVTQKLGSPFDDVTDLTNSWRLLQKAEAATTKNLSDDTLSRILRVRAKLTYIDGDHAKALEILGTLTDPGAVSLKLGVMAEESRWLDASNFAQGQRDIDRKWAAAAAGAHVMAGCNERAELVLTWAKSQNARTKKSCVLAYVKARYTCVVGEGRSVSLESLVDTEVDILKKLPLLLNEAFAAAFAEGPSSGLDAEALEMSILLGHVLQRREICQNAAHQLVKWIPASFELGRAVLRSDIVPIEGLADRFLSEYGDILSTQMLSAMLMIEVDRQALRAVALLLPKLAGGRRQTQEEVATTILIAAQYCTADTVRDTFAKVSEVLGAEHRLSIMLHAVLKAKESALAEARSLIEPLIDKNDHLCLQLAASLATQQGSWGEAARLLHRIGELGGYAEAYRNEAEAWNRIGEVEQHISALERAHALRPDDVGIAQSLAAAYHRTQRFNEATPHYEALWKSVPHSSVLSQNFANALVLSGDVERAIEVLKDYIEGAGDSLELGPLLVCAHLAQAQGDAAGALLLVRGHWDIFKSDHQYLMAMLQLGYAANEENEARKALAELHGMLSRGVLPEGLMWKTSLDEVRQHFETSNARRKFIGEQYLGGRLPWLTASKLGQTSSHSYVSWLIRTQPGVSSELPETIAELGIYSTNGFYALNTDNQKRLQRIVAPPKGSKIVADMSALITLHRLGILESACAYFEKVYLPYSYRAVWVAEQAKSSHHQPSQIQSQRAILYAVREGSIRVAGDEHRDVPRLNEYEDGSEGDRPAIRILQLVKWLGKHGRLSVSKCQAVEAKANQKATISDAEAEKALEVGIIVADPLTLQTIFDIGLLNDILNGIQVCVDQSDFKSLQNELRNQEKVDEAGRWYRDLASIVGSIPNVEFVSQPIPVNAVSADEGNDRNEPNDEGQLILRFGIGSAVLSTALGYPLLADDRYCQQGVFNHIKDRLDAAFGSDALLQSLERDGRISASEHADHFLKLISWRYKFLIPSVPLLRDMAFHFIGGLPGSSLRQVAVYLQDCMRDPGLFGGSEDVEPPMPMALKLFKAWIDTVGEFVASLWWDGRFTEVQAARLSRWAARYLLPAWPRNNTPLSWQHASDIRRQSLLGQLLLNLIQNNDSKKSNRAFNRVRRSLGFTDDEIALAAERITNVMFDRESNQHENRAILAHVLNVIYGSKSAFPGRLLPVAQKVGIVRPENLPAGLSSEELDVLLDRNHPKRLQPTLGPFAYIQQEPHCRTAVYMPEALCSPHCAVRAAALENLLANDYCPKAERTFGELKRSAVDILSDDEARWVPASVRAFEMLKGDFLLNLVGFKQCHQGNNAEGRSLCWGQIIQPTAEALLAIDQDGWALLPVGDKPKEKASNKYDCAKTVSGLLRSYDELDGHTTLAAPLDLGTQLTRLLERSDATQDVWPCLLTWLRDAHRPWRQYHACQALLKNTEAIPTERLNEFWEHFVRIIELARGSRSDSDDAQIWRLEKDCAAQYLRILELSGYAIDPHRLITVAWWAGKSVTNLLAQPLPSAEIPAQVRKWREGSIHRATRITRDAWAWLSPTSHSSSRFATLFEASPRSVALLVALGEAATRKVIDSIARDHRSTMRDCFCGTVLMGDIASKREEHPLWMWDLSFYNAFKSFVIALPSEERSDSVIQVCAIIDALKEPEALKAALQQLPETTEADARFITHMARMHCMECADAADVLLSFLRAPEWRNACSTKLSLHAWEILVHGLMLLQAKKGMELAVELPYLFLRLAEASAANPERTGFFLFSMTMSSLAGNTVGAIKALAKSDALPKLRPSIVLVRQSIEALRAAPLSDVSIRMQSVLTALEAIP